MKKTYLTNISRTAGHDKTPGTIYKDQKGFLTITVEVLGSIPWDQRGCWNCKKLREKGKVFSEEKILAYFSRIIEHEKCQRTLYKSQQGFFDK